MATPFFASPPPVQTAPYIAKNEAASSAGVPYTVNDPRYQESAVASYDRLRLVFNYLDDVNKEVKKFQKTGKSLAKACDALGNFLR
jgi:hypothetical protein